MLMNELRKLWEQHVMWTRLFIISTAANLGDLQFVTQCLLRNPQDFAKLLKKNYGEQKAEQFRKLFEEHLLIAADLVNAAKVGDMQRAEDARKEWYKNTDDISEFLASINPYWSKQEWRRIMYEYLQMTGQEAVHRLSGQYEEDIKTYELIENQALQMADFMASGIIRQFRI